MWLIGWESLVRDVEEENNKKRGNDSSLNSV